MTISLELRGIKQFESMSEETNCYSATLYLNGKKVAETGNHGTGGPDDVRWLDKDAEKIITDHFASLPKEATEFLGDDGKPFMIQPDLETWCGDRVDDFLLLRDAKRAMRKKVIGIKDGQQWQFKCDPASLDSAVPRGKTPRQQIVERHPTIIILNGMSDADLLTELRRTAA